MAPKRKPSSALGSPPPHSKKFKSKERVESDEESSQPEPTPPAQPDTEPPSQSPAPSVDTEPEDEDEDDEPEVDEPEDEEDDDDDDEDSTSPATPSTTSPATPSTPQPQHRPTRARQRPAQTRKNKARRKTAADKLVPESKLLPDALARHAALPGVRILENDKKLMGAQYLAGYLQLANQSELNDMLDLIQQPLEDFLALKKKGFGVPGVEATATFDKRIIFKEAMSSTPEPSWQALTGITPEDSFTTTDAAFKQFDTSMRNKKLFAHACYLAMVILTIKTFDETFLETHFQGYQGSMWLNFASPEDFHRALIFLKFAIDRAAKDSVPLGDLDPVPVRYLTDQQIRSGGKVDPQAQAQATIDAERKRLAFFLNQDIVEDPVELHTHLDEDALDSVEESHRRIDTQMEGLWQQKVRPPFPPHTPPHPTPARERIQF